MGMIPAKRMEEFIGISSQTADTTKVIPLFSMTDSPIGFSEPNSDSAMRSVSTMELLSGNGLEGLP